MNERIQELADQAGIHFGRSATLDGNNIARFVTTSDMEKFAELIVAECCNFNYDFLESYREACEVNSKIREHFGVDA
jgi:hypothetical protein